MANIDQTRELNKLLKEQAEIMAAQEASLKNQLNVTQQLVRTMQGINMGGVATDADDLNRAISEAAQAMDNLGEGRNTTEDIRRSLSAALEESDEFGDSLSNLGEKFLQLAPVAGTIEGIVAGFRLTTGAIRSVLSVTGSLISSFFQLSAAILTAPFKFLSSLMGQVGSGAAELRRQIEEVREAFGDLATNESRAIMDAWRDVDHFGGTLAETGLLVWRTMGNMAESMEKLREMAVELGPTFTNLRDEFAENAQRLFAYKKGLGFSEDAMAGLGRMAQSTGMEMQEIGRQVTQMAYGMGEAFGINGKLISRDIGEMIADFTTFGNLAIKELASISVYAKKLGVDIKELLGVVDQFDNFEDAATSVAHLSQAFGIHLDTLDLVQAQNPAERIEQLRQAFFRAGNSIEDMTRQEKKLLEQQTGLKGETLRMTFAQKNQSLSYDQIKKQSEDTAKSQLTQAEAMKELADSIKRIVRQGGQMENSFFKIFVNGFKRGVRWTREWWGLMWRLRRAMRITRWTGMRVGQDFVKYFPGVKDFLGGLRDLFDTQRWRKMTRGVRRIFQDFFKALAGDDPNALPNLLERLKENFFNWFDASKGAGRRILDGLKTFAKTFVKIAGQLVAEGMKALGDIFRGVADFIKNPDEMLGKAQEAGSGILGWFLDVLEPAFKAIMKAWPSLRDGFMELIETAWKKIKPVLINFLKDNFLTIFGVLFGPSLIGGLTRGLTFTIGAALTKAVGSTALTGVISKATGILGGRVSKASQQAASGRGAMSGVTGAAGQAQAMSQATRGFGVKDAVALGSKLTAIATALSVGAVAVAAAVIAIKGILDAGGVKGPKDAAAPLLVIGATALAFAAISPSLKLLEKVKVGANALVGIGSIAAATILMAGNFWLINKIVSGIDMKDATRTTTAIGAMIAMYLGATAVVAAATAIGALVVGTSGIALAATASGMALLAAVVTAGTAHAVEIMKEIDKVKISAGFEAKVDAFVGIMKTMGGFAANMADLIDSATPSFLELAASPWGRNPEKEAKQNLALVGDLIQIIGDETARIVNVVRDSIQGFTERQIRAAPKLASLLSAVGDITQAIKPPKELTGDFLNQLVGVPNVLHAAANFMERSTVVISVLTGQMILMMKRLEDLPSINPGKIKAFSAFLEGVGSIMQAIAPSGGTAGILGAAAAIGGLSGAADAALSKIPDPLKQVLNLKGVSAVTKHIKKSDPAGTMMDLLGKYMRSFLQIMKEEKFFETIQEFMTTILSSARKLGEGDLKKVEALVPIFTNTVDVITTFGENLSPDKVKELAIAYAGAKGAKLDLEDILDSYINSIIDPMKNKMPKVITSLIDTIKGIPPSQIKRVKQAIPILTDSLRMVSSLTDIVNELGKGGTGTGKKAIEEGRMHFDARMKGIRDMLSGLFTAEGGGALVDLLKKMSEVRVAGRAKRNIEMVGKAIEATSGVADLISSGMAMRLAGKGGQGVKTISSALNHMFNPAWGNNLIEPLQTLGEQRISGRTKANLKVLNESLVELMQVDFQGMIDQADDATKFISENYSTKIISGVEQLIDSINKSATALKGLSSNPINLKSELQTFNDRMGLKGTDRLEVKQQPVNFTINLEVKVDSEELEKALIERKGTRIHFSE